MGNYVELSDIRDEGVTTEEAEDTRVESLIDMAEQYFEKMTGQHFYEKTMTMTLYSRDSKRLFLPVHIITCDSITIEGETIDPEYYEVYNRYMPDDRENPKIVFDFKIKEGHKVEIDGSFGYVQEDKTTPEPVKYAIKKLVIHEVPILTDTDGQEAKKRGRIISEKNDKYEYELSELNLREDLTGDPEIDTRIINYQAPIGGGVV